MHVAHKWYKDIMTGAAELYCEVAASPSLCVSFTVLAQRSRERREVVDVR